MTCTYKDYKFEVKNGAVAMAKAKMKSLWRFNLKTVI